MSMSPSEIQAITSVLEGRLSDALRQRDELLDAIESWNEAVDEGIEQFAADARLVEEFERITDEVWRDPS